MQMNFQTYIHVLQTNAIRQTNDVISVEWTARKNNFLPPQKWYKKCLQALKDEEVLFFCLFFFFQKCLSLLEEN